MKQYKSYLDIIHFDPKLAQGFLFKYLTNIRVVLLLVISIALFGLLSLQNLPRRLNPEVAIPIVTVRTILAGAAPDEVERLVTQPLESELQNATKLDTISSSSFEGASVIVMQFTSDVTPDEAQDEVQRRVGTVSNLPDDATNPVVTALDFEDVPVWQFMLKSATGDQASLERVALQLQDELEATAGVDRVVLSGLENEEVRVTINQEKAASLGIDPFALASAIQQATQSWPAGSVIGGQTTFTVSIDTQVATLEELADLPVLIAGETMTLGDVAEISVQSAPLQRRAYYASPGAPVEPAIGVSVYKVRGVDITKAQQAAQERATTFIAPYTQSVLIVDVTNTAKEIADQFDELLGNFYSTIALVFLTLLLFLGLRQAVLTSVAIPLAFLASFIVMSVTGQSLNFLSLFSLLLALGLLVDNAIVIITSMTEYYRSGKFSAMQTGLLVYRDFNIPIWTTTLTTVWAFLPLVLTSGIIGEFIKPIPIIVSSTLLASALIALFITLPLMMVLLELRLPLRVVWLLRISGVVLVVALVAALTAGNPLQAIIVVLVAVTLLFFFRWKGKLIEAWNTRFHPEHHRKVVRFVTAIFDQGWISMDPVTRWYQGRIEKVLSKRKWQWMVVGMMATVVLFSYVLLPLGYIQNEFFPSSDADVMYLTVELPVGTALPETERVAKTVFAQSVLAPGVEYGLLEVGQLPQSGITAGGSGGGENVAAISLHLLPAQDRVISSIALLPQLRSQFSNFTAAKVTVDAPSGGPPTGSDITVTIVGDDLAELQSIANDVVLHLESTPGVVNVEKSVKSGASKIVFTPDTALLVEEGIALQQVGFWLRTALSGYELATFTPEGQLDEESIKLYVTNGLASPEELGSFIVQTTAGTKTLSNLGTLSLEANPAVINRENGKRVVKVTGGVEGVSAAEVNTQLFAWLDQQQLPKGYSFATGGANEENQKSVQSILQAMVLSIILILATMVVQLGSFRKALIIVLVIPLAVTGVFLLFALTGTPLSFPALIGVLALFGIVVNNSIVMVDKINENTKVGMEMTDAIVDASGSRLQPIFFSSLTTIIGLIPITLSDPIWQGLGGALIAGLSFSGITMLLFIPVVYSLFFVAKVRTDASADNLTV